MNLYNC